jgi:hypothetical protein
MGLDLYSGDPMHLNQGFMTHLAEESIKQLSDMAGGSGWAEQKMRKFWQLQEKRWGLHRTMLSRTPRAHMLLLIQP